MRNQRSWGAAALWALAACAQATGTEGAPALKVAAAADLAIALPEIAALFTAQTGTPVTFSFGSSGLLAHQLENGGPFDVFASANVSFVDRLIERGRCEGTSRVIYGVGRVGVWSRERRLTLADLGADSVVKVAIPNPEHAPYGLAARQALERSHSWDALSPKLVFGENARQALQLAESGNTEAAFVPLSLATRAGGYFTVIDAALHDPLEQGAAACGARAAEARRFIEVLMSDRGRAIMRKYGFALPSEAIAAEP